MKIGTDGHTDTESRYNLWTAAVVLTGVCIRNGQAGFGEGLGKSPISSENCGQGVADTSCGRFE